MIEDIVLLSRLQFAITVFFHFIFVPLTIGLGAMVAGFEVKYWKTQQEKWKKLAQFWGNLFKINFAFGIVTGFAMTFQFGTNWGAYAEFMGDVFASPLALEALIAFFLEATFFGIWLFTSHKKPALKAVSMILVSVGTMISAIWIITANAFMQNPVGYEMAADGSKILLSDFGAVLTNPYLWYMLIHTLIAAYLLSALFMVAVSGYFLLKKSNVDIFRSSMKLGVYVLIISAILLPCLGMFYGHYVGEVQPVKAAAMESVWESGSDKPMYLIQIPSNSGNIVQAIGIPYVGSFLLTGDPHGEVTGLNDIAEEDRPPVAITFFSFRIMVILGIIFILEALAGLYLIRKDPTLESSKSNKYMKLMLYSIPLPYLAIAFGWAVAEVGRQPWIVYGLYRTGEAISAVPAVQIIFSMGLLVLFYLLLFFLFLYLMVRAIRAGPEVKEHA
ncbi:cytochrome ubiquinol oxidase subunit I [Methanimicrococcus blatticola]|uniref:Cytochrome bd-I ubiquinol oxidase subunit 1 apoprotein n=1 Tax=Methanimicrococcus blatticola TaxID=91560 RepID=A0A484F5D8_9EURY|nr:cytochrome ubiquinol oxidase subunit I [Methanimicrococcus blatticola]MCC2509175.1 cytochrome ubiquinol oxidase subunit I [Methanimicrococcus blatticola]TDQ69459.1 cytochrome bd-I ubiquinol oxidase subunit 1 apoprotein [Methanimicrococcus blatticola]